MRKSFEKDPSLSIFYDLNNYDPYQQAAEVGPVTAGTHKYMNSVNSNVTLDSHLNPNIKHVIKAPDLVKPKMEYEFDLDHDPKRYLTMKTKRKRDVLIKDKFQLNYNQVVKAHSILDGAILDVKYSVS